MKTIKFALILIACLIIACPECYAQDKTAVPDALTVIHSRKSVRNFTGESVSKEALDKIVRAGMAAPTAVNMQPWSFVIITDRKTLDTLRTRLPYADMLDKAGAAIIVCAIPAEAFQKSTETAILDTACASENILLAVEALGLGAVWTGVYPDKDRMDAVRSILGIPQDVIPLNVIPVGHPTGEDKPKDKYKSENIRWEKW